MKTTLTRLYQSQDDADAAFSEVISAGVPKEDISLIHSQNDNQSSGSDHPMIIDKGGIGASVGGLFGGGIGLCIGLFGSLALPKAGLFAGNMLSSAITGAMIGGIAGAAACALASKLRLKTPLRHKMPAAGGRILTVRIEDKSADEVRSILDHHHPAPGPLVPSSSHTGPATYSDMRDLYGTGPLL